MLNFQAIAQDPQAAMDHRARQSWLVAQVLAAGEAIQTVASIQRVFTEPTFLIEPPQSLTFMIHKLTFNL